MNRSLAGRQASKREEKSENVRAERWLETAPFILEMGLRGQVTQSRLTLQDLTGERAQEWGSWGRRSWVLWAAGAVALIFEASESQRFLPLA